MFRRNFLKWLGITPAVGLTLEGYQPIVNDNLSIPPRGGSGISPKEDENPNNLPIVKFDKDGYIENYKELLGDKDRILAFVREEDAFERFGNVIYGEVRLFTSESSQDFMSCCLQETKNSKTLKNFNKYYCMNKDWRANNVS